KDAARQQYKILLANSSQDVERLRATVRWLLGQQVAGLAVFPEMEPIVLEELIQEQMPVVLYDAAETVEGFTTLHFNHRKGTRMLVDLLHSLGHRRMGYVDAPLLFRPTEARRLEFVERSASHGVETLVVKPVEDGFAAGCEGVRDLLRSGFRPTAI